MASTAQVDTLDPAVSATSISSATPKQALRLRILWSLFALEFAILTFIVCRNPFLTLRLRSVFHTNQTTHQSTDDAFFANDPRLGSRFSDSGPAVEVRRAALDTQIGYMVVLIGDCAGCIKADLPAMQRESAKRGISMVVVTSSGTTAAQALRRRLRLHVPFVTDRTGILERELNLAWFGRPYYYSRSWKLAWLPKHLGNANPFMDPGLLLAIGEKKP